VQNEQTIKLPIDHPARIAQGRKYYERFVDMYGEDSDWVKRYVKAEYGDDPSGAAVFKNTFKSDFHIVDDTLLIPGYPILIGQDFGRNPWSLICQMDHMGRLLVHQEVPGHQRRPGEARRAEPATRPVLKQVHRIPCLLLSATPAASPRATCEESCFDALQRLGLPCFPAPTNDIEPRSVRLKRCWGSRSTAVRS
jgi:hypothetical protein